MLAKIIAGGVGWREAIKNYSIYAFVMKTRQKGLQNILRSDVDIALAGVYCCCLREEQLRSVVNCAGPRLKIFYNFWKIVHSYARIKRPTINRGDGCKSDWPC